MQPNEYELVDVVMEDGTVSIARIVEVKGDDILVSFLSPVRRNTFSFEDDIELIPKEAICGFYNTDDLTKTGAYQQIQPNKYEMLDYDSDESDLDFIPDEYESEDDDDDISLEDEE